MAVVISSVPSAGSFFNFANAMGISIPIKTATSPFAVIASRSAMLRRESFSHTWPNNATGTPLTAPSVRPTTNLPQEELVQDQLLLPELPNEQRQRLGANAVAHVDDHRNEQHQLQMARKRLLEMPADEHHESARDEREEHPWYAPSELVAQRGVRNV